MLLEAIQPYKKWIYGLIFLILAVIVVLIVTTYIGRIGKVPYTLHVAPKIAEVSIDGTSVSHGEIYLTPGRHTLVASHPGFKEDKRYITVGGDNPDYAIILLTPVTADAIAWTKKYEKEYLEVEGIAGKYSSEEGAKFRADNPVVDDLPYRDPYYTIGYKIPDSTNIVLTVYTSSPRYRYAAVQKIRDLGYDPATYPIEFVDFINPLEVAK